MSEESRKAKTSAHRSRRKTVCFYLLLLLAAALILGGAYALRALYFRPKLAAYERTNPAAAASAVFRDLFAPRDGTGPDWDRVVSLSGMDENPLFPSDQVSAALRDRYDGRKFHYTYQQISQAEPKIKVDVYASGDFVGDLTIERALGDDGEISGWRATEAHFAVEGDCDVTVRVRDDHRVAVNGVPLDERYLSEVTTLLAADALPDGTPGTRVATYTVHGMFAPPESVTATDAAGNEIPLAHDPATDLYEEPAPASREATPEERERALACARAYAEFMLGRGDETSLPSFAEEGSALYSALLTAERLSQDAAISYGEQDAGSYRSYGDEIYSLNVSIDITAKRAGFSRSFPLSATFFLRRHEGGDLLIAMSREEIAQERRELSYLFQKKTGEVLSQELLPEGERNLPAPPAPAEEGETFRGWAARDIAADGKITYTLLPPPDESGNLTLPLPGEENYDFFSSHRVLYPVTEPSGE